MYIYNQQTGTISSIMVKSRYITSTELENRPTRLFGALKRIKDSLFLMEEGS